MVKKAKNATRFIKSKGKKLMRLLKCSDCNQEISITSDKCPYCGSQKQFKNYIFMRKELSKEGITPMEMMNFQRRGGKIKIIHWGKWFKYGGITFVLLFIVGAILGNQKVEYTKPDGTIVEITQFELNKINEAKRDKEKEKDLLLELGKTEKYNYKKLQDIYSSLSDLRKDNKEYVEIKFMFDRLKLLSKDDWKKIIDLANQTNIFTIPEFGNVKSIQSAISKNEQIKEQSLMKAFESLLKLKRFGISI